MKNDWNEFLNDRMESHWHTFTATPEGQRRKEAEERTDEFLTTQFSKADRLLVEELLSAFLLRSAEDERRLYEQGMKDCVQILKQIGVLA